MKPTHTGIAVALALAVVILFFIFPGFSPFGGALPQSGAAAREATTTQTSLTPMPTELQATDETVGTGVAAAVGDTVTVDYVGSLTNGVVFDASVNHGTKGFTFALGAGQVIKGWDEGVVGMREGGKRRLIIPPSLAYGDRSVGNVIPANAVLVFEVELVKVQKASR